MRSRDARSRDRPDMTAAGDGALLAVRDDVVVVVVGGGLSSAQTRTPCSDCTCSISDHGESNCRRQEAHETTTVVDRPVSHTTSLHDHPRRANDKHRLLHFA